MKRIGIAVVFTALFLCACTNEAQVADKDPVTTPAPEEAQTVTATPTPTSTPTPTPTPTPEPEAEEEQDVYDPDLADKHVRIRLDDSGSDVFALWGEGKPDYRYGPSIMWHDDGSVDAWFASPAEGVHKELDWITYRHSDDGGKTWGDEKVVLSPTPNTADHESVCDPDVFCYDGYYYIGYTATVNNTGICNNTFLARSKNPDGPFEKWDGKGWGGSPMPIIYFTGVEIGWGVGEPSFVVVDDKIYVYSTLDSFSEKYGWVRATRVHTADITDPMWPGKLQFAGIAVYRNDATANGYTYADSDSWNVAYLEDSHKFIALTTNRRFKGNSCLLYYESDDGINFERVSELNTNVIMGCHNCGIMTDGSGHIKDDRTIIGYAYSGSPESKWGMWATRFAPAVIDYTDEIDREEDGKDNLKQPIKIDESLLGKGPIMVTTDKRVYSVTVSDEPINIKYCTMNEFRQKTGISADEVRIEKYDPHILKLTDNGRLIPIREGVSTVGVEYNGLRREICIIVTPDEYDGSKIRFFYPACTRYDISVNEPIITKIRPMAMFGDRLIDEMTGYELTVNNVKYRSSDTKVCTVTSDGLIKAVSPGTAVITVEGGDGCKYTVDVHVSE